MNTKQKKKIKAMGFEIFEIVSGRKKGAVVEWRSPLERAVAWTAYALTELELGKSTAKQMKEDLGWALEDLDQVK